MSEVFAAALGALAVIGIPIAAWFSRRATREGRLLLRVERLGSVYALIPTSSEKEKFAVHLVRATANLNAWLDVDNAKRRKTIRLVSGWTYGIGVIAVLVVIPTIDTDAHPWQSSLLGAVVGIAIAAVTMGTSFLLERSARTKASRAATEREAAAAALRMEALRRGESIPTLRPSKNIS
jgi:hypothetical protein